MLLLAVASLLMAAAIGAYSLIAEPGQLLDIQQVFYPPTSTLPPSPALLPSPASASRASSPEPQPPDTPTPTAEPSVTPTVSKHMRVGIVAGHAGNDSGAVCPDGLTEVSVNLTIAKIVVQLLTDQGYQVDLLNEFDDRLSDYRANALVSIHADSCEVPGASGFKVARVTDSAIPEAEDRLVDCLYREYEATTGMPRHPNSITDNMTNYHAFREINLYTPGAIIETGFLLDDRPWIVRRPHLVAKGIAAGVTCFLEGEGQPTE